MKVILNWIVAHLAALAVLLLRLTCKVRLHDDPRPALRADGVPYVYSVLHAHQVAAAMGSEPGTAAMVSQSLDGQLIVPTLQVMGVTPIRGSNRTRGQAKGGREALEGLIEHVAGGKPAYLAVDGPRGPRNRVHKGVAALSQKTGAAVINLVAVPQRRWILAKTWDRLQIPKPFCRVDGYFAEPVYPIVGESLEEYRRRIEASLNALELLHDPVEAPEPVALPEVAGDEVAA
ncbi:lysophospholipid acyltransferase family protein [Blastopirellula sp. JC732]|uniref:Lysophospholipid acyltransferase family protein n=1 Tax=Blastopirellula sediminis TaxID=2894196 RepID=A0A9X1MSE5_9BACT|nr:lysophospholipid acyltransferase family protein [Blastopirellula sediminis]MCC9605180.1 lysophospholipid acyltransferase family protein [Blastopirellula sediminis]MCC9631520.1 lysophospholipid acyltransferase family protein [Blastopirellula sediminis]